MLDFIQSGSIYDSTHSLSTMQPQRVWPFGRNHDSMAEPGAGSPSGQNILVCCILSSFLSFIKEVQPKEIWRGVFKYIRIYLKRIKQFIKYKTHGEATFQHCEPRMWGRDDFVEVYKKKPKTHIFSKACTSFLHANMFSFDFNKCYKQLIWFILIVLVGCVYVESWLIYLLLCLLL